MPLESLLLLSGPIAVGKSTIRQLLTERHGYETVRSSAYLRQLAGQRNAAGERTGLQNLGDELDRDTDYRWLIDRVAAPGFEANPQHCRWLVDAVRKQRQVQHFRDTYGPVVLHVHLTADEEVLRERYDARNDMTSYAVAVQHDNEVSARQLIRIADLVIDTGRIDAGLAILSIIDRLALAGS